MGGPPAKSAKSATIRLVFSLERSEDPRLFDDLAAMRKGVKRAARLRLLAHDGLLLQQGIRVSDAGSFGLSRTDRTGDTPLASLTNQVFGPPADE
jgi:hypothetical protein